MRTLIEIIMVAVGCGILGVANAMHVIDQPDQIWTPAAVGFGIGFPALIGGAVLVFKGLI